MFHDEDNRQIAGVCAGLGRYFGLETSLIRIVFLLGFIGIFSGNFNLYGCNGLFNLMVIIQKGRTLRNFEAKR